ncbi:hypothetical protein AGABI1DRAFT_46617 [Agaricus bisporus var. burnettii JB137-S8]|uniref:UDP-glucose:glycoprotein glucosyltransferase n=1 Tax=Agaricus bisporus var. burnettii (strain JB137-S8 / ATCC MYA-4627 / FGSC 10392) TaxID=597362 RepID=K5WXN8_AGABU|nr:uncharacterized protein AGABI1DRAFT_46617 [Agaricus bisporus var. burnettii JB137-S8]EKM75357.1 hypothetical protein AGABI1DRAFT_46617 [Agaricus bisporus var. burnettii JB137-S8]
MAWALAVLGACLALQHANAGSPPVRVSLTPSWPDPPVVAEVLESVALVNPDGFFQLLDQVTDPDASIFAQSSTPQSLYQSGISSAVTHGVIQGAGDLAEVHMNLYLHAATPKLEAFYQHYEDRHKDSTGTVCGSWVDWYGQVVCDLESLVQLVERQLYPRPKILTFDHIHPSHSTTIDRPHRTAILYATLDSENFRGLHSYLYSEANKPEPRIQYVLRHVPPQGPRSKLNYLSGYGVSLDLKKMDYLAIDDRYSSEKHSQVDDKDSSRNMDDVFSLIQAHPENETLIDAKATLTEEEFNTIGYKAVQLIAESTNSLQTVTTLSQNFPKYATSLSRRVQVNSSIEEELGKKARKIAPGANYFWFNGQTVAPRDVHVFGLMNLLKKEKSLMKQLIGLGLERSEALEVMTHAEVTSAQKDGLVTDGLLDASDRPEKGDVIVWFNDIENDPKYMRGNPSVRGVLQAYPGSMPNVRRNLFNIILVLDLRQSSNIQLIGTLVYNVVSKGLPYRFGLVPLIENEDSLKMAKVISYMLKNFGWKITTNLCQSIANPTTIYEDHPEKVPEYVSLETVKGTYIALMSNEMDKSQFLPFDDLVGDKKFARPAFTIPTDKITRYVERLGAGTKQSASGRGHVFFNGKPLPLNAVLADALQAEAGQQLQYLQEKVYLNIVTDETHPDISTYFYDLPTTQKRRNQYIVPSTSKVKVVSVPEVLTKSGLDGVLEGGSWMYPSKSFYVKPVIVSLFVVADFDSEEGKETLKQALEFLAQTSESRVTFLHNPSATPNDSTRTSISSTLAHLISTHTLSKVTSQKLSEALDLSMTVTTGESDKQAPLDIVDIEDKFDSDSYGRYVKASRLAARALGIKGGETGIVINGRVIAPLGKDQFSTADFVSVVNFENKRRAVAVADALRSVKNGVDELDGTSYANLVSMLTSTIGASQQPDPSEVGLFDTPPRPRSRNYQILDSEYTAIKIGNNETALYHVAVVMDPLSLLAQKWSSLLQWLSTVPDVFVEIHMNPGRYTEMPLKRFYRYNVIPHATLSFDKATGNEIPSEVVFDDLPIDPIYTLAMDVPPSWLVRPRVALYDLDNILLTQLSPEDKSVDATFSLDYLVVEGHARNTKTLEPPRGVQLELVKTSDKTPIDDTLVVANLGYLQFKAKPGVFQLQIREGRGRKIFEMESVGNEGWNSPSVKEAGDEIVLDSFEGSTLYPRLERLPGMEWEDVLDEEENSEASVMGSFTNKFMSMFGKEEKGMTAVEEQADINIFTVASGLLYERFASIMILSVLRNTKSSVKFWFIENFLSPSFLEFIPHMAEKYGFKYELVTYKWPSWLRAQSEKQRIIWAYKILFLDVLFPMDLKKVVFVDADQIVRADLQELVDLDLQGAPYAFTPMGDDNTAMEGFRFWKTGYWKDFLQGLPYHISALYVIDLWKFRQMTAGDILRGQYQALSMDPNSLSNLDQDLPNNLQRQVPIFSLHEDWLWCETWCNKDRLDRAKTIDLCQNPLTKEPKLSRARQIPEWEEYDSEIAHFARELAKEGKIRSRFATADADVLASASAALVTDEILPVMGEPDYMEEYEDTDAPEEPSAAEESKISGRDEL